MRALFLIPAFFISFAASSKCTNSGTYPDCSSSAIYPLSGSRILNKNGLVILEFYGWSQRLIDSLNIKYPVYLQSSGSKVILLPIEILKGEFRITQVVLKPASELIAGKTYQLHIDNLPQFETEPVQYNPATGKREPLSFTINNYVDHEFPVFSCTPLEVRKIYSPMGCGPSTWVIFQLSGYDKSELFVKATVKNKATGKTTTCIVEIKDGHVSIGHHMCSGPFNFDDGNEYEVSFRLFDQSGNEGEVASAIAFTRPEPSKDAE